MQKLDTKPIEEVRNLSSVKAVVEKIRQESPQDKQVSGSTTLYLPSEIQ